MTVQQKHISLIGFLFPLPGLKAGYTVPVYVVEGNKRIQSIDPRKLLITGWSEFSEDEEFVSIEELQQQSCVLSIKDKYFEAPMAGTPAIFSVVVSDQLMMGTLAELFRWFTENRRVLTAKLKQFPNFRADLFAFLEIPEQIPTPISKYTAFTQHARAPYDIRHYRQSRPRELACN